MTLIGEDFRASVSHALYRPFNPIGLWPSIGIFIGLLLVNQFVFVWGFGVGIFTLTSGRTGNYDDWMRAVLLSILPAGLATAGIAWVAVRQLGADPGRVLALRPPDLGLFGWAAAVGGFVVAINGLFLLLAALFGFDLDSSGLVEKGTMQFGNDPLFFFLIAGGLVVGAPLAEELIFRGQIFAALALTPLGTSGASLVTSALWALTHAPTQPMHVVGLLFLMGLLLCWLLVRFGSLWVTIACHAVWNAIAAAALYSMASP